MHPLPDGWKFSGDLEKPTFEPSFKHDWNYGPLVKPPKREGPFVCHYVVTNGMVSYCGDCSHAMANRQIEMPVLPEYYRDPNCGEATA